MPLHVAILMRPYLKLILAGRKTVESRLTKGPLPPYRRIQPGERIYFKASAGPYMATAVADAVEFHEDLTPAQVAELRRRWNHAVCGDAAFWQWKRHSRYATFITLREVQPTNEGPRLGPSPGPAWFVLDDPVAPAVPPSPTSPPAGEVAATQLRRVRGPRPAAPSAGTRKMPASGAATPPLTRRPAPAGRHPLPQGERVQSADTAGPAVVVTLTAGAVRNRYLRLPSHAPGPITLVLPDGRAIDTEVTARGMVRWRGWAACFTRHRCAAGSTLTLRPDGSRRYRVAFA